MVRGALDQDRAAPRRGDVLDEGVLLLPEGVLEDEPGAAEHVGGRQLLDRVDGDAPAGQDQALHVAPLGAAQGQDPALGERVERERVDALLVHEHEAPCLAAVGAADLVLEVDDLLDALVGRRLWEGREEGESIRHFFVLILEKNVAFREERETNSPTRERERERERKKLEPKKLTLSAATSFSLCSALE